MSGILKLTPRKLHVYDFILKYKQTHDGIAPSVSEIGKACEISSTSAVRHVLNGLVLFGMIECDYGKGNRMISIPGARWTPPFGSSPTQAEARALSSSSSKS